jgi:hypothetical protein
MAGFCSSDTEEAAVEGLTVVVGVVCALWISELFCSQ